MRILLSLVLFTGATRHTSACENGFFPNNDLFIPSSTEKAMAKNAEGGVIAEVIRETYNPIFKKEGKHLIINFLWNNPAVNAYATRDDNNNPIINITGGMLGHDILTQDGLALILCHEVGHFLGGSPKKLRGRSTKKSWSSAEGQADYFATAQCLKKVFKKLPAARYEDKVRKSNTDKNDNKESNSARLSQELVSICKGPLCKRIAMASFNVASLYAAIDFFSGDLSLVYKDDYTVYQTIYNHPNPQCRLDTMIAALQCPDSENIIFKTGDELLGACKDASFRRPRCWYYPTTSF